jgi:antitoxin HigA-1
MAALMSSRSSTITEEVIMPVVPPIHPGETLLEDCMKPASLSANRLARELQIPASRVLEIVNGRRAITADTALRLGRYFNTSAQFWMNLQARYDLEVARNIRGKEIDRVVSPRKTMSTEQRPHSSARGRIRRPAI